jgi:hypothetical protein
MRSKLIRDWRVQAVIVLLLVLAALYGVSSRLHPVGPGQGAGAANATNSCHYPIGFLCPNGDCEKYTYTDAVAELEDLPCRNSWVGTCGDLRYVRYVDRLFSSTTFFDQSGQPVAARRSSDEDMKICRAGRIFGSDAVLSRYPSAAEPDCKIVKLSCGNGGLAR